MFIPGDYIVKLTPTLSNYLLQNNVYIQSISDLCLKTNLDSLGTSTLSSDVRYNKPYAWRYATLEEIAEYDRLGKPYDVTTIVSVKETDYNYLIPILKRFKII